MKIAFDLDGVLYDFTSCFRVWMENVDREGKNSGRYQPAPTSWDFYADDWGMTLAEFKHEMSAATAAGFLYRSQGIGADWLRLLHALVEDGHTLHAVTHRAEHGAMAATEDWVRNYELPFTTVTFAQDKSTVGADVLIEDRGENLDVWLEKTDKPCILVERAWNERWRRGVGTDTDTYRRTLLARDAAEVGHIIAYLADTAWMAEEVCDDLQSTNEPPAETVLEEANRLIHGARQADYGHPIDDFTKTAGMWSAAFGWDVEPEDIPMAMIMVKISREQNRPKRDNAVDIAGYAGTLAMVRDRQGLA